MKSVVPDVPSYAPPHYKATPEKAKDKPPAPKRDFKVVDAALKQPIVGALAVAAVGILVPDFTGKSMRTASDESDKLGLDPVPGGTGRVIEQYPPAGTQARPGTPIQFN